MSAEFGTSVDLREVSPGSRIAVAIYTSCLLRRGEAMEVIADHDPVDLLTEFQRQPDRFGCEYLERSDGLARSGRAHALTGLPNPLLFDQLLGRRLAGARRHGTSLALLAIDLDGFKAVNDMHGHPAGDAVLKAAASRISGLLRESDVVARLGGDEFAVLLDEVGLDDARHVASKLIDALSASYAGVVPAVSASVGIAMHPEGGRTLAELCRTPTTRSTRPSARVNDARPCTPERSQRREDLDAARRGGARQRRGSLRASSATQTATSTGSPPTTSPTRRGSTSRSALRSASSRSLPPKAGRPSASAWAGILCRDHHCFARHVQTSPAATRN